MDPANEDITVPAGGDLMNMIYMQMFVHGDDTKSDMRQFAFRELTASGTGWDKTYNQEKGILDIYMELDTDINTFTLWVLATGGYDEGSDPTPRPESWPKEAIPSATTDQGAKDAWRASDYCHHTVYVSRATWKLNNITSYFTW